MCYCQIERNTTVSGKLRVVVDLVIDNALVLSPHSCHSVVGIRSPKFASANLHCRFVLICRVEPPSPTLV